MFMLVDALYAAAPHTAAMQGAAQLQRKPMRVRSRLPALVLIISMEAVACLEQPRAPHSVGKLCPQVHGHVDDCPAARHEQAVPRNDGARWHTCVV